MLRQAQHEELVGQWRAGANDVRRSDLEFVVVTGAGDAGDGGEAVVAQRQDHGAAGAQLRQQRRRDGGHHAVEQDAVEGRLVGPARERVAVLADDVADLEGADARLGGLALAASSTV